MPRPRPGQPDPQPAPAGEKAPEPAPAPGQAEQAHVSPRGTRWYPSPAPRGSGADWDNARTHFRMRTTEEWVALFDRDPGVVHQVLGDIFREVRAQADARAGKVKIGRRPRAIDGSLAELEAMITPRYSMDTFADALRELMGEESLRSFSARAGLTHPTVVRMMAADQPLEAWRLEALAKAGGVHPSYFREWREVHVLTAISQVLQARPNLSLKLSRHVRALQESA